MTATCPVDGCSRPIRWNGMCNTHAHRVYQYGDPHFVKYKRHGKDRATYNGWLSMIQRCTDPSDLHYKNYGGRGITVCERWKDFENFYADMGKKPDGLTLDRIDNDAGYSPDNCRWATRAQQQRNRRCNRLTIEDARSIRARWGAGEMQKDIAADYGLAAAYVSQIVNHRIWREEQDIRAEGA